MSRASAYCYCYLFHFSFIGTNIGRKRYFFDLNIFGLTYSFLFKFACLAAHLHHQNTYLLNIGSSYTILFFANYLLFIIIFCTKLVCVNVWWATSRYLGVVVQQFEIAGWREVNVNGALNVRICSK